MFLVAQHHAPILDCTLLLRCGARFSKYSPGSPVTLLVGVLLVPGCPLRTRYTTVAHLLPRASEGGHFVYGEEAKASTKHDANGNPVRNFCDLLDHLATLTRDRIRYHDTDIEIDKLTDATPEQRRAFELIDAPIPLTIAA